MIRVAGGDGADGAEATARAADVDQLKDGAALLARHGNRVAALAVLWAAVAIDPADHAVHRRLAATLAGNGDPEAAANEYARYVELRLARGELEAATAELHYAAVTLGRVGGVRPLAETTRRVARSLPELFAAGGSRGERIARPIEIAPPAIAEPPVRLPVAHPTRVTLHTCLHDDGDGTWLQLEGTGDPVPEQVRLLRAGTVLETRRCTVTPAIRSARSVPGDDTVWVVLRAPDAMLRDIDRDEADDYTLEALVQGEWIDVDARDTGCRSRAQHARSRSA